MVSVVSTRNNRSNELFNESCHFPPKKKESVLPRGTTSTHACFFHLHLFSLLFVCASSTDSQFSVKSSLCRPFTPASFSSLPRNIYHHHSSTPYILLLFSIHDRTFIHFLGYFSHLKCFPDRSNWWRNEQSGPRDWILKQIIYGMGNPTKVLFLLLQAPAGYPHSSTITETNETLLSCE